MSCRDEIVHRSVALFRTTCRSLMLLCALALGVSLSQSAVAQGFPPGIMVCQTPVFWCVVPSQDYPTGVPCWCNSMAGPVGGYAINPRQVAHQSAPPPSTSQPTRDRGTSPDEEIDLGGKAGDCLNGLGNCDGSFTTLVRSKSKPQPSTGSRSGCAKDTDCKGDRVCENGRCVDR